MPKEIDISEKPQKIHFSVDGNPISGYAGDTIASVLYAHGMRAWHRTRSGDERGVFCGIGMCFDCLVTVNGIPEVRACLELIAEGMEVVTDLQKKIDYGN